MPPKWYRGVSRLLGDTDLCLPPNLAACFNLRYSSSVEGKKGSRNLKSKSLI